jgi:hypothetical protein
MAPEECSEGTEMTVAELIAQLSDYPPEMEVWGYYADYEPLLRLVTSKSVQLYGNLDKPVLLIEGGED